MSARILYLVPTLLTGGLERMVFLLASGIDRTRFSPEILVFDRLGPLAEDAVAAGIPVDFEPRSGGFLDRRLLGRFAARLRRDPPELIHAHNATALVYATFGARLAGGHVPVVYTEHDRSFPGSYPDRALHYAAGRMVERVIVVAEWLADALVRWEKFPSGRLAVIPNGIAEERFAAAWDAATVRRDLGVPGRAPLAACVARLVPVKNHPALLTAWRRIADVWPGATLLLVGDGPGRAEVEAAVRALRLEGAVRVLGERSDVPRLLASCDFHVLASHSEGMSLTLLEAMAAGKVSVATRVGGNPEVIEDGVTGLLVPPGDVHALSSAMAALVRDPARAERMGRAARARFRSRFTVAAMIAAYEAVYQETLGRPAREADAR